MAKPAWSGLLVAFSAILLALLFVASSAPGASANDGGYRSSDDDSGYRSSDDDSEYRKSESGYRGTTGNNPVASSDAPVIQKTEPEAADSPPGGPAPIQPSVPAPSVAGSATTAAVGGKNLGPAPDHGGLAAAAPPPEPEIDDPPTIRLAYTIGTPTEPAEAPLAEGTGNCGEQPSKRPQRFVPTSADLGTRDGQPALLASAVLTGLAEGTIRPLLVGPSATLFDWLLLLLILLPPLVLVYVAWRDPTRQVSAVNLPTIRVRELPRARQ